MVSIRWSIANIQTHFMFGVFIIINVFQAVRVLLCVSCVPASCVHIWFVSCPRLMSLWVNSCPAVFVSLSVINLCILVHACSVWFRLVYLWLPGVSCLPALMSWLKTIIWVYVLFCVFQFLPLVCTVTQAGLGGLFLKSIPLQLQITSLKKYTVTQSKYHNIKEM